MKIEERIALWRGEESGKEVEMVVPLLCDAEEELIRLRAENVNLKGGANRLLQEITFDNPSAVKVVATVEGETFLVVDHNFVNSYEVSLDEKGKQIFLRLDLNQLDAGPPPLKWLFNVPAQ